MSFCGVFFILSSTFKFWMNHGVGTQQAAITRPPNWGPKHPGQYSCTSDSHPKEHHPSAVADGLAWNECRSKFSSNTKKMAMEILFKKCKWKVQHFSPLNLQGATMPKSLRPQEAGRVSTMEWCWWTWKRGNVIFCQIQQSTTTSMMFIWCSIILRLLVLFLDFNWNYPWNKWWISKSPTSPTCLQM